jgi:hypothetical protein
VEKHGVEAVLTSRKSLLQKRRAPVGLGTLLASASGTDSWLAQAAQTRAEMKKLSAATEQYREDPVAETNQENTFFTGSDRLTSRENGGD